MVMRMKLLKPLFICITFKGALRSHPICLGRQWRAFRSLVNIRNLQIQSALAKGTVRVSAATAKVQARTATRRERELVQAAPGHIIYWKGRIRAAMLPFEDESEPLARAAAQLLNVDRYEQRLLRAAHLRAARAR